MNMKKLIISIVTLMLIAGIASIGTLPTLAAASEQSDLSTTEEYTGTKNGLIYVDGKLYNGYYIDSENKMYSVKTGIPTLKTGTLKSGIKYYSYNAGKKLTLAKQTLYVKGTAYTGYYLDSKNRMYIVKNGVRVKKDGTHNLKTGTLKAGTKYYSYTSNKTLTLKKQTLYVKGYTYTGYYADSRNKMYIVKNGIRVKKDGTHNVKTGVLKAGTKYYSNTAKKIKKLSKKTLYVNGKAYTGYYADSKNKMYRVKKGAYVPVNTTVNAGSKYYSYKAGKKLTLSRQTVYINGKAVKGMSAESLAVLQRAQAVVNSITDDSMTKKEKLKVCFDYVKKYTEIRPRTPHYIGMDWPIIYANDMFINGAGNCCSYAAAFAYMAKAIGYEEVYCCNSGGHGWAEIDGLVYDPEWSKHHFVYNYYALSYDTKTDQNYKGSLSPEKPWMRIKL